jgi:hypothetical protein
VDVAAELRDLAARGATGCLDVTSGQVGAQLVISEGRLHAITRSGAAPALGMRLVSGGRLSLTNLGVALSLQQRHPGLRLGDALVRMGLVSRQEVEAVAWEQMCDDLAAVLLLPGPTATFTPDHGTPAPAEAPAVADVLAAASERMPRWQEVVRAVGGPDTVPDLTDALLAARDESLRPEEWAVLCRVDGRRSLMSIARQAGFTTLEAASILQGLVAAGLVSVPAPAHPPVPAVAAPQPAMDLELPEPVVDLELPEPVTAPAVPPPVTAAALPAPPPPPAAPPPAPEASAAPAAGSAVTDLFDDPSDLLRELSEIGGSDMSARRRGR